MSDITIKVRGFTALQLRLSAMAAMGSVVPETVLRREATAVLNDCNHRYVPVETDDLRRSGRVSDPYSVGSDYGINISYGGDGTRVDQYAIAVHEHPSTNSPPSWQGKGARQIRWSKPGTGPKYLLNALTNAVAGMLPRIATHYQAFLARHKA